MSKTKKMEKCKSNLQQQTLMSVYEKLNNRLLRLKEITELAQSLNAKLYRENITENSSLEEKDISVTTKNIVELFDDICHKLDTEIKLIDERLNIAIAMIG